MTLRDDEEDLSGYARAQDVYKSDKGRADQLERKAREKGQLLNLQRQVLRGQVTGDKLAKLEPKPSAGDDAVAQAQLDAEAKKHETFGTKTLKQQEDARTQGAMQQATTDAIIEENARKEDAQRQAAQEYQQDAG